MSQKWFGFDVCIVSMAFLIPIGNIAAIFRYNPLFFDTSGSKLPISCRCFIAARLIYTNISISLVLPFINPTSNRYFFINFHISFDISLFPGYNMIWILTGVHISY